MRVVHEGSRCGRGGAIETKQGLGRARRPRDRADRGAAAGDPADAAQAGARADGGRGRHARRAGRRRLAPTGRGCARGRFRVQHDRPAGGCLRVLVPGPQAFEAGARYLLARGYR